MFIAIIIIVVVVVSAIVVAIIIDTRITRSTPSSPVLLLSGVEPLHLISSTSLPKIGQYTTPEIRPPSPSPLYLKGAEINTSLHALKECIRFKALQVCTNQYYLIFNI
jgi:hypothetical protein